MKEIIYQLECVKEHLNFINRQYNQVDFDIKVLEGCIDILAEMDKIIFPQTIGNRTFYNSEELIEWVKFKQDNK